MEKIQLVVFDMAGTTVKDDHVVESCFYRAAVESDLQVTRDTIKAMQGLPKRKVVATLWENALGSDHPEFEQKVESNYAKFRTILEQHYLDHPPEPTDGTVEIFEWLRNKGIRIALTTGFYRKVANIILRQLGWDRGLNENYCGSSESIIDLSLTPDETGKGRPHPDMIFAAMKVFGLQHADQVIKIGDTPADLQAGKTAGCRYSLAVTYGTHNRADLAAHDNDGLLDSILELKRYLTT